MNRQQRRELAKRQETQAVYFRELEKTQMKVTEDVAMLHMMAYAIAIHDAGYGEKIIEDIVQRANTILNDLDGVHRTFWTIRDELKRKTGIEIQWKD